MSSTQGMGVRLSRLVALALVATLLALGGCSRDADGQLPSASGEAITAKREAVKGFGLVAAYPDEADDTLAIAVEFSRPLVGTQSFDDLLAVRDGQGAVIKGSWVLDDDGRILRFPHVEAGKDYDVRIGRGITAASGERLGKDLQQKVHTGPLEPAVGFASQGSVLPARESRGLPVVSVNVPEVDVEFMRVREKSLAAFFAEYQRGGRRGAWQLEGDYGDKTPLSKLADPVYLNRFVLGGKPNERVVTHLPLQDIEELQQPGLYFAVMKRAGQFADEYDTAFFTVSDLGIHARAYKEAVFVHAASLASGDAVGKVNLRVLDARGETVFKAETDSNGNALLDYTLDAGHVLLATRERDISMLPFNQPALDLSEFAVAGREPAAFDVFAWSGRDLYRPGETVRVSALLRDRDGMPLARKGGQLQPVFLRYVQPDGKALIDTRLQPDAQGYVRHAQAIPQDAATGRWRVEFRTDPASKDAVQGMTLRIEEFLPERLKLDLTAAPVIRPGQPLKLAVDGAYLYGAPAAGNRFTAKLAVKVEQHPVESLPGYFFGDPTLELPKDAKDILDTTLDASGNASVDIALPVEAKPVTPIAAIVTGSVFETGGRSVNRSLTRVLWPADALVGVRPLFNDKDGSDANSNARFELLRVDSKGVPKPASKLRVTLVREHRDYHWTHDDEGGWDYDFNRRFEDVQVRTLDAGAAAVRFDFPVEWGEYRVDVYDPATQLTTRYPFTAGWSWDDSNRGLDARPDKVKLALDKTAYKAGDTLKVTLTPPHAGKGVLMVESDRMLYVQAIDAKAGSSFDIPVTKDWERHDVYITALVFRGGSAPSTITPARAVGVAHVPMDRRNRVVAVGLAVPKLMRPERALPVVVSAPAFAGQDAYVTIAAVDQGILNITRFPVPDAATHFFAQRRLGVDAYDVYSRVIESFEGGIAKMRFGGDMALDALPQARRPTSRVQTVDLFAGPVKLDAKGLARINLAVPDFNGTLRVSAVVYSGGRYGSRSSETVVRAPVLAEASLPRVLAPGDRSRITLDVQNFSGKAGTFKVQVDGVGPITVGEGTRTATLAPDAKTTLSFPVTATEGFTTAQVRVRVDGNGFRVDRRYDLPVRPAWPQVMRSRTQVLNDLEAVRFDAGLAGGLMPGSVNARMTVSALPPIPFASALKGALEYPYGCAEQTTSKGYAALMLDASTAKMLGTGGLEQAKRTTRMEGAFSRLAAMQTSSGHFSMWGDDEYVNQALTPYIVEFLLDAKRGGFAVPDAMLQKALKVLSEDVLSGGANFYGYNDRDHMKFAFNAHAGYVLARVNRAPLGTLRAMWDSDRAQSITGLPLVHLGLALHLQGDIARGTRATGAGFAVPSTKRPDYLGDYGSRLRDDALMIALVHEHDLALPAYAARAVSLGRELDARRNASWFYLSTQEQVALARMGKALMADQAKVVGGTWRVGDVASTATTGRMTGRMFDSAALSRGASLTPTGAGPLYASFEVAGIPRTAPAPDKSVVDVRRRWFNTKGEPWTGSTLAEGEALIVQVTISPSRSMPDALLTDLLPAGLEIENFNLGDAGQWAGVVVDGIDISERNNAAEVRHEEFRDDRYVAALKLDGGTARVFYLVRAVTPGTYTVPPSLVEDMYRPDLRGVGVSDPATITVVAPGRQVAAPGTVVAPRPTPAASP